MSTEIAKSFTWKDLAETYPHQLASLEHLRDPVIDQLHEMPVPVSDSEILKEPEANVVTVPKEPDVDLSSADAEVEVAPVTQFLNIIAVDVGGSDYSIQYSGMIPPTGVVFGGPVPWSLPSDIGFVDVKDIIWYTGSDAYLHYHIDMSTESSLLIDTELFAAQFSTDDIFPAAEPFFV